MSLLLFLSENPTLRLLQFVLLTVAVIAVYLVFFVTRDVILRSRSFLFQFFAIILTAVLPIIGFLLYLLMRPSQTLRQREMEVMLQDVLDRLPESTSDKSAKQGKKSKNTKKSDDSPESSVSPASPDSVKD